MASAVPISQHVRNVVKGCKKYPFKAAALGNVSIMMLENMRCEILHQYR